jgi:hypothetical protein
LESHGHQCSPGKNLATGQVFLAAAVNRECRPFGCGTQDENPRGMRLGTIAEQSQKTRLILGAQGEPRQQIVNSSKTGLSPTTEQFVDDFTVDLTVT